MAKAPGRRATPSGEGRRDGRKTADWSAPADAAAILGPLIGSVRPTEHIRTHSNKWLTSPPPPSHLISSFLLYSTLLPSPPLLKRNEAAASSSTTSTTTSSIRYCFAFHPILSSVSSLSIDFSTLRERARFSSLFFFTLSLPPSFCVKRFKYSQTSANVQQSVLAFFSLYPFLLLYIPIHSQRQKKRRRAHTHSYFTHIYSTMGLSCAMRASRRTVAATAIR